MKQTKMAKRGKMMEHSTNSKAFNLYDYATLFSKRL
jgi:hypothetical protein